MADITPLFAMKPSRAIFVGPLVLVLLLVAGCEALGPVTSRPQKIEPPFAYEQLDVRNSCFVESVHFYDVYMKKKTGADDGWVRVLQWGNLEGDYKIANGHAIAVYVDEGRLCGFDSAFGFWRIDVPVEKRGDLTEVGPKVFAYYPSFKPVFVHYREDFEQPTPPKTHGIVMDNAGQDLQDAARVAGELGRYRPVSVVAFNYTENGIVKQSFAAVFVFGGRLCVYFPSKGTHISVLLVRAIHDLEMTSDVIGRIYPGATNIRLQPGSYLIPFPKIS